jgi:hypothetical protein
MTATRGCAFAVRAAVPVAMLVVAVSLAGILLPATYAHETSAWRAQALGQDWVDLAAAACLLLAAARAWRGSLRWTLVLGGALLYFVYTFAIYTFAVHFNRLFLAYCAVLGLSSYALAALSVDLIRADFGGWLDARTPARSTGVFLIAIAVVFGALWLMDVLPAIAGDTTPRGVVETGLLTNPVHVLDLSIVLPLHLIAGVALLRRRPLGLALAPMLLAFGVLMAASIAGMMVVMRAEGQPAPAPLIAGMAGLAAGTLVMLMRFVRVIPRREWRPSSRS